MRLGLMIESRARADPLESMVAQGQAIELCGLELAWLPEGEGFVPPFLAAAALAVRTSPFRMMISAPVGRHPLAIAEAAAVADNCLGGRAVLVLQDALDDPAVLEETVELTLAGLAARPFRHRGERWHSPANLPENDGTEERIRLTPRSAQVEVPVWAIGRLAGPVAAAYALSPILQDEGPDEGALLWARVSESLGKAIHRMSRPGIWSLAADMSGDFDDEALVRQLREHQHAWGLDHAVLTLPVELDDRARARVARRLAVAVRPRVIQHELPEGLDEYWREALPGLMAEAGLGSASAGPGRS
jgi:alkanesulfonate monooxygenase SsuD/methylene tetrahydromethanopterin reductase-like flavin-dependent oxidoreductase (luciferase family)